MKTPGTSFRHRASLGFTLLEMIGVMAIIAILAAVVVPNGVRAIDRAAITAEAQTLRNLGDQAKLYLVANGAPPGLTTPVRGWNIDLGIFADLSATDVLTNKRQMVRSYVYEPVAVPKRVLIISSMRNGLTLPVSTDLNTVARFDHVWNTADRVVPSTGVDAWAGWAAWRTTGNGGDFLVVERVNLSSVYNTQLLSLTITLNNKTPTAATGSTPAVAATPASYVLMPAIGTSPGRVTVLAGASVVISSLRPRDRIDLYRVTTGGSPDSSYVLSTNSKTFDFNGTNWIPQ